MIDADLQARFDERVRELDVYARTWWAERKDPHATFLRDNPEVRVRLRRLVEQNVEIGTQHVYTGDLGQGVDAEKTWAPTRVVLHDETLTRLDFADEVSRTSDGPSQGDVTPAIYFLLGLPGSGKTRSLRPLVGLHSGITGPIPTVDADEVRVLLPEYAKGLGSGVVQFETAMLTYGLGYRAGDGRQQRVWAGGNVTIVDTIGNAELLPGVVQDLTEQGRDVYVLRTDCPAEVCIKRAMRRTLATGRYVPLELIREKVGIPEAALEAVIATDRLAGWAVVNTEAAVPRIAQAGGRLADMVD